MHDENHPHRQRGRLCRDRLEPSLELIEKGNLDYISYECLAERTIAIGQQAKLKDPSKDTTVFWSTAWRRPFPCAGSTR
mgnify:CR=1 FL=1